MQTTSHESSKKRRVPSATRQLVLLEAGYMCANPTCRHILTLELHHTVWVKEGGGNEPSNLLPLCPNCHSLHTAGHIPHEAIRVWKGMLLALNSTNRANIDTLLHLCRQSRDHVGKHIRYSGDTLLHLAGLINAGLVETAGARIKLGGEGPLYSSFMLRLTDAGLMLVRAWLAGNEAQFNEALLEIPRSDID